MSEHTYAVIMAGGGGTRLWPVSRKERPKQLLPLIGQETLFQSTTQRLENLFPPDRILVVTVEEQAREMRLQAPEIPEENYIIEPGTERVGELFRLADGVFISAVTPVECASVLSRLKEGKAISESQVRKAMGEMNRDFAFFEQVDLDPALQEAAQGLVFRHRLRALDAIQLASASARKTEIGIFAACDRKLLAAATSEGFKTENPAP